MTQQEKIFPSESLLRDSFEATKDIRIAIIAWHGYDSEWAASEMKNYFTGIIDSWKQGHTEPYIRFVKNNGRPNDLIFFSADWDRLLDIHAMLETGQARSVSDAIRRLFGNSQEIDSHIRRLNGKYSRAKYLIADEYESRRLNRSSLIDRINKALAPFEELSKRFNNVEEQFSQIARKFK